MRLHKFLLWVAAALALSLPVAGQRITDADERYRIKFGRYPPAVERQQTREAEAWRYRAASIFDQIDTNRDGVISREEWQAAQKLLRDNYSRTREADRAAPEGDRQRQQDSRN